MEPVTSSESVFGALGVTLKNLIAGAVGSFISLNFFDKLDRKERWATCVSGMLMGAYLAKPLNTVLEQKPEVEVGLAILLGLFGMALTSKIIHTIKETDWIGLVKTIFNRGGGS